MNAAYTPNPIMPEVPTNLLTPIDVIQTALKTITEEVVTLQVGEETYNQVIQDLKAHIAAVDKELEDATFVIEKQNYDFSELQYKLAAAERVRDEYQTRFYQIPWVLRALFC